MRFCFKALTFITLLIGSAHDDIMSTSGNILFDANSDGNGNMNLNSTGLGIGTLSPSSALEVSGVELVSRLLHL
ncbi:MAG: hypothetical protein HQL32_16355 [Planctomycetes bacterium]|nr:hypothetical protein [Planctomycetota bacterium]